MITYFTPFEIIKTLDVHSTSDLSQITSDCRVNVCCDLELDKKYTFRNLSNIIIEGNHTISIQSLTTLKFLNCRNILLKDLKLVGVNIPDHDGEISLQLIGCNSVHLDHVTFLNGEDEQLCIKHNSNNISLSDCVFEFDNCKQHSFAVLINLPEDRTYEYSNVRFYQCTFNGGSGRYPRCRYANVYLTCCTWKKRCSSYLIWPEESNVYIDNCCVESSSIFCLGIHRPENHVYVRDTEIKNCRHQERFMSFPEDM